MKGSKNRNMDGKKTKRRKSLSRKRHGSMEEKPKSTEVMNEKEKQDRLEAASALSSLMFLPPKSSIDSNDDESMTNSVQETPSSTMPKYLRSHQTLPGIPTTLPITPQLPKLGRPPKSAAREANPTERNKAILAELENKLRLDHLSMPVVSISPRATSAMNSSRTPRPHLLSSPLPLTLTHSKPALKQVPLTVVSQAQTVNQDVAKALRNAVSKNTPKVETDRMHDNLMEQSDKIASIAMSVSTQDDEAIDSTTSSVALKKKDNSDTNLPLKKRRLVGMTNSSSSNSDILSSETNLNSCISLATLKTSRQIENILQMETEQINTHTHKQSSLVTDGLSDNILKTDGGYRPVQVDPRTSLMVLSDLKFALTPDEDGDLPLHIAVVHEDIELVKKFVDIMLMSGKTVDRFNKLQQTPLHLAILVNQPDIVRDLISAGANPNLLDRHGFTTVHSSVCKQFDKCMNMVFETAKTDLNLNCRDYEGYYPLHTCVELNNLSMLKKLVRHGADVNTQDGKAGRSVLMYAVEYNRCDIVQYLLEAGANAELQNYAGVTPLMIAQAAKMEEMINHLNKALDIVKVDDQQYIPAKKVPISRMPSRTDFSDSKKRNSMTMNGVPLIYEEYDRSRLEPQESRPSFSRQSSTSSPIDLSIRGNYSLSPSPSAELVQGRQPRKKGKKENRHHKEKHSQKSNVIEKHASLVAALESKAVVEKSNVSQSDRVSGANNSLRNEVEDKSNALHNLLLNLNPEDAQQLIAKVVKGYGFQLKAGLDVAKQSEALQDNKVDSAVDKVKNHEKMQIDTNSDIDTASVGKNKACELDKCMDIESEHDSVKIESKSTELHDKIACHDDMESGLGLNIEPDSNGTSENISNDITNDFKEIGEPMDQVDSPVMPVLSRATSECQEVNENTVEDLNVSAAQSVNNSPTAVINKVYNMTDNTDKQNSIVKPNHSLEAEPDSAVTTSSENVNFEVEYSEDCKSITEDDTSAALENFKEGEHEVVTKDSDNIFVNESSSLSSLDTSSHAAHYESDNLHKHSESNEQNQSALNSSQTVSDKKESLKRNYKLVDSHVDQSDQSDDSMEYEVSDIMKHEILGNNDKIETSKTVMNNSVDDDDDDKSKMDRSPDNIRNSIEENTLVMDLDDDRESDLVIDEKNLDDENISTDKTDYISKIEDIGDNNVVGKSGTSENASEIDMSVNQMIVKDSIKGRELAMTNDENSKKGDFVQICEDKSVPVKENCEIILAKGILNRSTISEGNKETSKALSYETTESLSIKPSSEPVSLVDNLLKTGQSHVLYYHDGDKYKPVRIFIDNSEQSSKVLKQMIQSAQFSTVNSSSASTQHDVNSVSKIPPKPIVGLNRSVANVQSEGTIEASTDLNNKRKSMKGPGSSSSAKSIVSNNGHTLTTEKNSSLYPKKFIESLKDRTGNLPDSKKKNTSTKLTKRKSSPSPKKSDVVLDKAPSGVKQKRTTDESEHSKSSSNSGKISVSNTETVSKSVISSVNLPGRKVTATYHTQTKPVGVTSLKALYNEGTLTRVNPDIKSRLSKALQSSQRKTGLDKSDPDTFSGNSGFDVKCIPVEVIPTIPAATDTRQQL